LRLICGPLLYSHFEPVLHRYRTVGAIVLRTLKLGTGAILEATSRQLYKPLIFVSASEHPKPNGCGTKSWKFSWLREAGL
jgi:hypothetical protein